jgi:hypothetical protein
LQVLSPNGKYKGQKAIKDVARKMPPIITNINPIVPVTVCVKYKAAKTIARITLIIRSAPPMFFFIYGSLRFIKNIKWFW